MKNMFENSLKIVPLGGLNEIGKNITLFICGEDILVLDCGLTFPDDEMFGVDIVIPDITFLQKNKDKIRGIALTHGHEDHIGALPYVLKEINVPVYGTKLTLEILKIKLKEHKMLRTTKLITVNPGETFTLGCFKIEFIRSNHSIADAIITLITTPIGNVLHTGDFKIDCTPIDGEMLDLTRVGEIGKEGVLALLSDSTNSERPGYSMSERTVGEEFEKIFEISTKQRIFIATFASNIHRVQQVINSAVKFGRKVAVCGRSMINVLNAAFDIGYMKIPTDTLIDVDEITKFPKEKIVVITTGSQGEPMSALSRMASSDHKKVTIEFGDLVIISANPIPGNERTVSKVVNELFRRGADVIYEPIADVHVSGHACQEELKIMLSLAKPKFFIPVHGEHRHLIRHKEIAKSMGYNSKDIFIMDIGNVLEIKKNEARITGSVAAGKVFVDGLGVGDVGNIVLRDRKHLAQDGLIIVVIIINKVGGSIVSGPDVISRGFVYVRESEFLMNEIKKKAKLAIEECNEKNFKDWSNLKSNIKKRLSEFLFDKTKRKPMILPIIMEA
ncbi:MAG: ribonuclease J [Clostridiales bacterium]|nr:ribonuclease J [Clostridiales bacterium]